MSRDLILDTLKQKAELTDSVNGLPLHEPEALSRMQQHVLSGSARMSAVAAREAMGDQAWSFPKVEHGDVSVMDAFRGAPGDRKRHVLEAALSDHLARLGGFDRAVLHHTFAWSASTLAAAGSDAVAYCDCALALSGAVTHAVSKQEGPDQALASLARDSKELFGQLLDRAKTLSPDLAALSSSSWSPKLDAAIAKLGSSPASPSSAVASSPTRAPKA